MTMRMYYNYRKNHIDFNSVEEVLNYLKKNIPCFSIMKQDCVGVDFRNKILELINNGIEFDKSYINKNLIRALIGKFNMSTVSMQYYIMNGYTEDEAKEQISIIQRKRSPASFEYWISRGHTIEEATDKIKTRQKHAWSYNRTNKENWENMEDHKQYCRKNSPRTIEYWLARGYSKELAAEKVKIVCDSRSIDKFIRQYGNTEIAALKYNEACLNLPRRYGKDNHQFGKPAPKKSGNGISGTYKNYYFRSLLEYFYMKHLENLGIEFICNDVSKNKYENKVIIKMENGRNYIPDFIVNDKLIEIKSYYHSKQKYCMYKIQQTQLQGYNIMLLTENDFPILLDNVLDDINSGILVIDTNKVSRFKGTMIKYKRKDKANALAQQNNNI